MSAAGFLHMEPEMLRPPVQAMAETGTGLETTWQRTKDTAATAEAGIGTGRLAAAFRAKYDPARATAAQDVDPIPQLLRRVTEAAGLSVRDYERADDPSALDQLA